MESRNMLKTILVTAAVLVLLVSPVAFAVEENEREIENVVELETGVYYIVQEGDTLWDLSQRFSDTPWLWPDLWEENNQISNPHQIYPGERIRLFRKKDYEKIIKKDVTEIVMEEPEPEKKGLQYYYSQVNHVGFVRKSWLPPYGKIFKVRDDKELIGTGDVVYIMPNPDTLELILGERYTIYRNRPWTGSDKADMEKYGYQYYLVGVLEIIDREGSYLVGDVVTAYRAIHIEDYLLPYEPRSPYVTMTEGASGTVGRVFMAEERQELIGTGHIVFLDKGEKDGLKTGQVFKVYYQESESLSPNTFREPMLENVPFGDLLILHIEDTTATALVTRSTRNLKHGAVFGDLD